MPGEFSKFIQQTLDIYFRYYHEFPFVGYIYFLSLLFLLGGRWEINKGQEKLQRMNKLITSARFCSCLMAFCLVASGSISSSADATFRLSFFIILW